MSEEATRTNSPEEVRVDEALRAVGVERLDDWCRCGHRRFEHVSDGCAVRQMYGPRYLCDCPLFEDGVGPDSQTEGAHL